MTYFSNRNKAAIRNKADSWFGIFPCLLMSHRATEERKNKPKTIASGKPGVRKTHKLQVTGKCGPKHLRPAGVAVKWGNNRVQREAGSGRSEQPGGLMAGGRLPLVPG